MSTVCPTVVHEKMKDDDATWRGLTFGYVEAHLFEGKYEWFETRHCHCGSSIMRATVSRNRWRLWDPRRPHQILAGYPSTVGHNGAMTLTLPEYRALREKRYRWQGGCVVEVPQW